MIQATNWRSQKNNIIGLKKEGNKRLKVENEIEDNNIIKEPIKQKVDFFENTDKIAKLQIRPIKT